MHCIVFFYIFTDNIQAMYQKLFHYIVICVLIPNVYSKTIATKGTVGINPRFKLSKKIGESPTSNSDVSTCINTYIKIIQ